MAITSPGSCLLEDVVTGECTEQAVEDVGINVRLAREFVPQVSVRGRI